MPIRTLILAASLILILGAAKKPADNHVASGRSDLPTPVVILKLDDVTRNGAHGKAAVSPRWQQCVDFLQQEKVKASLGIIGESLEGEAPAYFDWIKDLDKKGAFEFWNHGYVNKADQFKGPSEQEQREALEKTQRLAREKLGITLKIFGAHWSDVDIATDKAMAAIPELKIWFEGPKQPLGKQLILARTIYMEKPTFVPNFANLKTKYELSGYKNPYLLLQGHPNQWTDARFADFKKIVLYLKEKGCRFMTASEYKDFEHLPR